MGVKVIRTWAFSDGERWNSLQPQPKVFSEKVFQGLDWLIHMCSMYNIRLVLCFTDYWGSYGGMKQYVEWCSPHGPNASVNEFYTNRNCLHLFQNYVHTLIHRVNTYSRIMYRDDPTIMTWELANEARCKGNKDTQIVANWVDTMSRFVKSIDPNHLVTLGDEGFFGDHQQLFKQCNPFNSEHEGVDFIANGQCGGIDYLSIHIWPDQWLAQKNPQFADLIRFSHEYIREHTRAAQMIGKPLVVEEFGFKSDNFSLRFEFFHQMLSYMQQMVRNSVDPLNGVIFWMLASHEYENYDGYNVYPHIGDSHHRMLKEAKQAMNDDPTFSLLTEFAGQIQQ
eukprot:TRINITY_DN8159_c1_g1_i1.p1 TRINITY_DN8159_c1_g1~~TRINITY_DN8159_c1_g1_i1.p1  ORF type:complete len:378 (+),score=18.56 TRINITY_DN8159_c1_g1_i1:125-1135(+)